MEYTDLSNLAKKKGISINSIAEQMGLSRQGLYSAVVKGTFTQEKILQICRILEISPNEYLGWESINVSGNIATNINGGHNTQNSNEVIATLRDQLKEKDRQISRMLTLLEKLRK